MFLLLAHLFAGKITCTKLATLLRLFSSAELEACSDDAVRLVGGPNEFEGRVEVCIGGVWGRLCTGTVSSQIEIDNTAAVVCRQLHDSGYTGITI